MPDKVLCKQLHATHAHNIRAHTRYSAYEKIKAGDVLSFSWKHRLVMKKVVQVIEYSDFESMLRHEGVRACLPHLKDNDFTAALRVYHSFPDYKTKANHYGVVAFKLAPLNRTPVIQSCFNMPSLFLQAMVAAVERVESMQNRTTFQPPTPPKMTGAASAPQSTQLSDGAITTPIMTGAANAPQPTQLSDGAITTPIMTGAANAPQSTQLIQKVAQRIANGEKYRTACEALGFNLNENKKYKGSNTPDYSRLQSQVKKAKDKKRKVLVKWTERLIEELKKVTFYLRYVTERYRVLQEKLGKCECASSRKRKITHLSSSEKQSRGMIQ